MVSSDLALVFNRVKKPVLVCHKQRGGDKCDKMQGNPQKHQLQGSRRSLLLQAISISKAINTQEAPVKEKHARRILSLGSPGWCRGDAL